MMRLNLRLGTPAVLAAQRTLCLHANNVYLFALPTSFYHKYCGDEVPAHTVM